MLGELPVDVQTLVPKDSGSPSVLLAVLNAPGMRVHVLFTEQMCDTVVPAGAAAGTNSSEHLPAGIQPGRAALQPGHWAAGRSVCSSPSTGTAGLAAAAAADQPLSTAPPVPCRPGVLPEDHAPHAHMAVMRSEHQLHDRSQPGRLEPVSPCEYVQHFPSFYTYSIGHTRVLYMPAFCFHWNETCLQNAWRLELKQSAYTVTYIHQDCGQGKAFMRG